MNNDIKEEESLSCFFLVINWNIYYIVPLTCDTCTKKT